MRNFIIGTLSFLLGFEPALMAQGDARRNADMKAFIEMSGLSQHPVSVRELYKKFSPYLPMAQKEELKNFVSTYGDMKIPKMDVSKIKVSGGGDEIYKLQVVDKGQSVAIEFFNDAKQFARVNGQVLTPEDMKSTATVMTKIGVPADMAAREFKRPLHHSVLLMAEDIGKMKRPDQVAYFKDLRALFAASEAVQHADMNLKNHSASNAEFGLGGKFDVVVRWMRGEDAFAIGQDDDCTAAGYWTTKVGMEVGPKGRRMACGTDGKGGVLEEFRRKSDGSTCAVNEFACNPVVYGEGAGNRCVSAGKDTTRTCNEFAVVNPHGSNWDIPELAKGDKAKFEENQARAEAGIQSALANCREMKSKEGASAPPRGKGAKKNPAQGLIDDQLQTCEQAELRYATIKSWDCKGDSKSFPYGKTFPETYPQLCKEKEAREEKAADAGKPTQTVGGDKPAAAADSGKPAPPSEPVACGLLPKQYRTDANCAGGSHDSHPGKGKFSQVCVDPSGKKWDGDTIYECICNDGTPASNGKCDKNNSVSSSGSGGGKKEESFFEKNKQLLMLLGAGAVGLIAYNYFAKKQVQQSYEYLQPAPTQKPPVVAPPAVPVPRATQ